MDDKVLVAVVGVAGTVIGAAINAMGVIIGKSHESTLAERRDRKDRVRRLRIEPLMEVLQWAECTANIVRLQEGFGEYVKLDCPTNSAGSLDIIYSRGWEGKIRDLDLGFRRLAGVGGEMGIDSKNATFALLYELRWYRTKEEHNESSTIDRWLWKIRSERQWKAVLTARSLRGSS